jgi:hypothetical protein
MTRVNGVPMAAMAAIPRDDGDLSYTIPERAGRFQSAERAMPTCAIQF